MTQKKFLDDAISGSPLKIYWITSNDFDEEVEEDLYVCLSSNKTFKTLERGVLHFKKDTKAKAEHIKAVKALKKSIEKEKKEKFKKVVHTSYYMNEQALLKANDPKFARMIWRGILYHVGILNTCQWFAKFQEWSPIAPCGYYNPMTRTIEEISWEEMNIRITQAVDRVDELRHEQCLNPSILQPLWYSLYHLWDRSLRDTMPTCPAWATAVKPNEFTAETCYYATDTMEVIDF
jgi:hypothetical protein